MGAPEGPPSAGQRGPPPLGPLSSASAAVERPPTPSAVPLVLCCCCCCCCCCQTVSSHRCCSSCWCGSAAALYVWGPRRRGEHTGSSTRGLRGAPLGGPLGLRCPSRGPRGPLRRTRKWALLLTRQSAARSQEGRQTCTYTLNPKP